MIVSHPFVRWYRDLGSKDVEVVGGKNASLGEMIGHLSDMGVRVPDGFATTAQAFRHFLDYQQLPEKIASLLKAIDVDNIAELAQQGAKIRALIQEATFPKELEVAISSAYHQLCAGIADRAVAVRSSATAEDLPEASFAGQQETFLNVRGEVAVLAKVKEVFASLFNDRAIAYRVHQGYADLPIALSAGIQLMVRSDLATSGVMFTLDTESGFDRVVLVTAAYGLGEMMVQGAVDPDEFYVYKPGIQANRPAILSRCLGQKQLQMIYAPSGDPRRVLTQEVPLEKRQQFCLKDAEVESLAKIALTIESHYGRPMDIEWAKDGEDGQLYIVQARPETVKSQESAERHLVRYELQERSAVLCEGRAIGQRIGAGTVKVVQDLKEMHRINPGDVLVTDMTDPDWEPVMKRAGAIVTNRGGRTCHAAIIAREMGIPAVVGCGQATQLLKEGQSVTVSCSEGEVGQVFEGILPVRIREILLTAMPPLPLKMMMNVGNPERAFDFQRLPNHGVGLARMEFVISRLIGIHPNACLNMARETPEIQHSIREQIKGYENPVRFYVEKLIEGMARLAAAFAPNPVILRFSDFKSNEYANLIGGRRYEPHEENPMLGFRGASRYVSEQFQAAFALECEAVKFVREQMGLRNLWVMIPFVRTVAEAKAVLSLMQQYGLTRGENELLVIMMCELPTNCLLADEYLEYFDGFSIGSNDLTQLTLGLDRDSGLVAQQFDERDPAVKRLLSMAIQACLKKNKYVGICGQGPSDHPDLAQWLMQEGIQSVSLNPDSILETWLSLAK